MVEAPVRCDCPCNVPQQGPLRNPFAKSFVSQIHFLKGDSLICPLISASTFLRARKQKTMKLSWKTVLSCASLTYSLKGTKTIKGNAHFAMSLFGKKFSINTK